MGSQEVAFIKNVINNRNLKGDINQLRKVGECYKKLQQLKADYAEIGYHIDFSGIDKLIDKEFDAWVSAAEMNPLDEVKISCYESAIALRPDSKIQKKLKLLL